jgi:alpha-amylase/alpha-mannosidase (GH57 family)
MVEDMSRSKKGQAEHDREGRKVANEYLKKGYKVLADLPNQERPDTVKGVRPDLSVKKKGHETLIEVETPESVESARDEKQKKVFKQWSEKSQDRHFRRIITEE